MYEDASSLVHRLHALPTGTVIKFKSSVPTYLIKAGRDAETVWVGGNTSAKHIMPWYFSSVDDDEVEVVY